MVGLGGLVFVKIMDQQGWSIHNSQFMNWIFNRKLVGYDFISHDLIECEFQFSNVVFMYYLLSYSFIQPLQIQSDY